MSFYKKVKSAAERLPLRIQAFVVTTLLLLLTPGCLEQIDIEPPKDLLSAVVINGKLTKGTPSTVRVEISALFNFSGSSRRYIDVREVLLLNEAGESLSIPTRELGIYFLEIPADHPSFSIDNGASYRLRVSTRDGRTYESRAEPILESPKAESLQPQIIDKEVVNGDGELTTAEYVRFTINTPIVTTEGGSPLRLKWDALRTYRATDLSGDANTPNKQCYVTQLTDVNKLYLLDGPSLTADIVNGITVHEEPINFYFAEGYYLTVLQQALSEEAFTYWSHVQELRDQAGTIFAPPAGKVRSNFKNVDAPEEEAFGFFYAVNPDTVRLYISPEFVDNPKPFCPPEGPLYTQGGDCRFPLCCYCEQVPGSSVVKPAFWVE